MESIVLPATHAQDHSQAASAEVFDALRVQSAAVAAQQAALTEEEARLASQRAALEKHEEQLAAHLEEKRVKLLHLSERANAERGALEKERTAYEQQIVKLTGDMTEAQRELLQNQKQLVAERKRLSELQRRLRQRWHRFWLAERQKIDQAREALNAQTRLLEGADEGLQQREQALAEKRLHFNGVYEMGRCRLREAWQRLHQEQFRWKHRRGKERVALKVRGHDLDATEQNLLQAQAVFIKEKHAWDVAKTALHAEAEGLETRVRNQREKLIEQQRECARLDAEIQARKQTLGQDSAPAPNTPLLVNENSARDQTAELPKELEQAPDPTLQAWHKRFQDLDHLAGALADQRSQLIEHWRRVSYLQAHWENDRQNASRELEMLAQRLVDNGHLLTRREHAGQQADQVLRARHEELLQVRQQMIAWRARLRVREQAWEGERQQLLTEVKIREELADQHLNTLVDLRQRWTGRRREELAKVRAERHALETARKENGQHRLVLIDQVAALEADKRILAEKSLALEQYRQEFLARGNSAATERRLERLRRRWLTLNAAAIRTACREREAFKAVLQTLEVRFGDLQTRADIVAQSEADLIEKQTAWEHKQALATARQTRMQHELQSAEARRNLSEQQVARMKEEIERIARALIDEPDPPVSEALNPAA